MRSFVPFVCIALAGVGCKKTTTGGGGGGGGWLVGSSGLMENISADGKPGAGYDLGSTAQLNGIACRYQGEAWVVGAQGTLLYTNDGGITWSEQAIPTSADLRALATQDAGPVFVAGTGAFFVTTDTGAHWQSLGNGATNFRALAAAQEGTTVLAVSDDAQLWSYDNGALAARASLPGARAVALSPAGDIAAVAGAGMWKSDDGGASFTQLAVDPAIVLDDVRVAEDGSITAVGAGGAIVHVDALGAVTVQHVGSANLHALHIADPDAIDSVGYAAGDGGTVWITHDSGVTWSLGPTLGRTVLGVDEIGFGHR